MLLNKRLLLFFCLFVVLCLTYSPTLIFDYAHHDSYRFLLRPPGGLMDSFNQSNINTGRALSAVVHSLYALIVNSVDDLKWIRLITMALFSICGVFGISVFKKIFDSDIVAFCLTWSILTLPPFQVMIFYAGVAHNAVGILLSCLSVACVQNAIKEECQLGKSKVIKIILALVLMLLAFNLYASTAAFYWVGVFLIYVVMFKDKQSNIKRTMIALFSIGVASQIIYFIFIKALNVLMDFSTEVYGLYNPYVTADNYFEKMLWFIKEPMANALNFWNIFPRPDVTAGVLLFSIIGLVITLRRKDFIENKGRVLIGSGIFVATLLLSFSPNIVAQGEAPWYRCSAGAFALVMVGVVLVLNQWTHLMKEKGRSVFVTVVVILTLFGTLQTTKSVLYYRVLPSFTELKYLKDLLKDTTSNEFSHIHIIQPDIGKIKRRYDEYGMPTTAVIPNLYAFSTAALREVALKEGWLFEAVSINDDQRTMTYHYYHNKDHSKLLKYSIHLTGGAYDTIKTPRTITADMTFLVKLSKQHHRKAQKFLW